MKTKKILPIMLSGLLFLCACTATSPTTKPTAATTPSATVTPIPKKVDAWGQISQASLQKVSNDKISGSHCVRFLILFKTVNKGVCEVRALINSFPERCIIKK